MKTKKQITKEILGVLEDFEIIPEHVLVEEEFYMPTSEEEFQADLDAQDMRYFQYCREQEEMYNDPVMNWSGLR